MKWSLIQHHCAVYRCHSHFTKYSIDVFLFLGQNSIKKYRLHLVALFLPSSSVWNNSSVVSTHPTPLFLSMPTACSSSWGQRSNSCPRSDPSHSSYNAGFLTARLLETPCSLSLRSPPLADLNYTGLAFHRAISFSLILSLVVSRLGFVLFICYYTDDYLFHFQDFKLFISTCSCLISCYFCLLISYTFFFGCAHSI